MASPILILLAQSFYTASWRSPLFILLTRIFCPFGTMKVTTKAIKHAITLEMPSALMKGASQYKTSLQECFCRDGESLSTPSDWFCHWLTAFHAARKHVQEE